MSDIGFDMFQTEPWSLLQVADLREAALIPTMLTFEEQRYYVWLTRDWARGEGAIVDLGAFAGGSTACLAEGQKQAGWKTPVHGYDRFHVKDFESFRTRYQTYLSVPPASERALKPRQLPRCEGDDLRPLVAMFLEPWEETVHLHKGQIEEQRWTEGPIEILVLDASKTAEMADRICKIFFPHLIPGRSIIVQQDFLHWKQPWLAAQMAMLAAHFEPVAYVPKVSVSYLCTRAVDAEAVRRARIAGLSDRQMIAHIRQIMPDMDRLGQRSKARRLVRSVRANPGCRKAYRFRFRP